MRTQPGSQIRRWPIGKDIDKAPVLEIDQRYAVRLATVVGRSRHCAGDGADYRWGRLRWLAARTVDAGTAVRSCARYVGLSVPLLATVFFLTGSLDAQVATGTDHTVVIEIGGAGEWPLQGERPNYGATLAAETTPIEHWLEVEAGATLLGTSHRREIAADFIVKKPFEISSTVELMAGLGPELSWSLTRGSSARSVATECALDLMVWPTKNVGWYLEPTYDLTSFRANGRSLALATGLIVGLPWLR